jgi:acyl transferase domain-containing protein/3-hydroxymyristoyl/3-hydroxydecanoyl-(acyl carrier protein) dehydratase
VNTSERVAIVGLGGLFPGSADPEGFWRSVAAAVDTAREPPPGRWLIPPDAAHHPEPARPDHVHSHKACFLDAVPLDPAGLPFDPEWLDGLDPSLHLVLHAGRRAWADARTERLDRRRVGVILGHIALPTERASAHARHVLGRAVPGALGVEPGAGQGTGPVDPINRHVAGLPAGLLARALGLGGGHYTLDAACASSLYAVKLAADELLAGRADAMLAGGLSRPDSLYTQMGFSQLRAVSPSGRCSPFDHRADGLIVGEGCGVLVLKRLSDAVRGGDRIYGVIAGVGLSNDIEGNLLAPSSDGQLRAMRAAYAAAGWSPGDVDLIECHATGTPLGDRTEFASLRELWSETAWRPGQCVIGSVKSTVGHLLTAAGSAGLIKVLLAMRAGTLPPTANFERPAPGIDFDDSPFRIPTAPQPWRPRAEGVPRRAAVSAFGFGGINAHLLVEEWVPGSHPTPATRGSGAGGEGLLDLPPPINVTVSVREPGYTLTPGPTPGSAGEGGKTAVPIAVVGMDARFGSCESLAAFRARAFGADTGSHEPRIHRLEVPAGRFRIPPRELAELLPQQVLALQVAAAALDDAGPAGQGTPELCERTGVFLGVALDLNTTNFHLRWWVRTLATEAARGRGIIDTPGGREWVERCADAAGPPLTADRTMGGLASIAASRVARTFRFGGPSFTVSGEESSGLRALEVAARLLALGEIDRAVVGAVDFPADPRAMPAGRLVTERARPFEADADGTVPGEGAAAVVLKRLDDARRDGDRVYAVLRGVGAAGGGVSDITYTAAVERAHADGGTTPESVRLLEANAGGDPAEDAAEAAALARIAAGRELRVTSVKAEIGHAGAAAGLAGFVRTALAIDLHLLPPLTTAASPRPDLGDIRLTPHCQFWLTDRNDGPRRAGVSALGTDGSCLHAVLEEPPACARRGGALGPRPEALFAVEADDAVGLDARLERLIARLATASDTAAVEPLAAAWWRECPSAPAHRLGIAFVARDVAQARRLAAAARARATPDGADRDRLFVSDAPLGRGGQLAFVFPGSGNHFAGMARDLGVWWPDVLRRQQAANTALRGQLAPHVFWPEGTRRDTPTPDALTAIFGQVSLGALVADVLADLSVRPDAVLGLSLGESSGLFASGAWRERDEMFRRMRESTLFTADLSGECNAARAALGLPADAPFDWSVALLSCPAGRARELLTPERRVWVLIETTPDECVVGGPADEVRALASDLGSRPLWLPAVSIAHCDLLRPVEGPYRTLHLLPTTPPAGVRYYSGAWGRSYTLHRDSAADAILGMAIAPIDFPRVVEAAYADGVRLFVEIGPGSSCTRMIKSILGDRPHLARPVCTPKLEGVSAVLRLAASLIAERVPVDLAALFSAPADAAPPADTRRSVTLPVVTPSLVMPPALAPAPTPAPVSVNGNGHYPAVAAVEPAGPSLVPLLQGVADVQAAVGAAHAAFLRLNRQGAVLFREHAAVQAALLQRLAAGDEVTTLPAPPAVAVEERPFLDTEQCFEFARGSIAAVLGAEFAPVDAFPTRVRLPDGPLMLVDRIVSVSGEPRSMTHGNVVTEHDIHDGRWYLDNGVMPTCVAVEAGQADLFLSGYLGIDFLTRGLAVYRLLDAVVTFHRGLPRPGETVRYDIHIDRFFRQGDTHLFRFRFEGTIGGEPFLSMRDGCAGFFSESELAAGKGIVRTELDRRPVPGKLPPGWSPPAPLAGVERYSTGQVEALRRGDLAGCFGQAFARLTVSDPLTLPGGMLRLVDRVTELDPAGGRFGLGRIRADFEIHPDDWFLTCHFVDDMVMPGTLMYECCLHTLRILLLRLGWVGSKSMVTCEPLPGVASRLKCRGQVIQSTRTVTYEVSLKELGYGPDAYAIADVLMYADGKPVVEITDMSLRLTGLTADAVAAAWATRPAKAAPLFDRDRILAFAVGKPSEAFGDRYRVFDSERVIARLPGPPYQFLDRITAISGCEPWRLVAGGTVTAEYDVPPDEWYFAANRLPVMPFAVLLEIALQPCGWLAAYLGSALTSPTDLSFRNLGGRAVQHEPVGPDSGTLSITVTMTKVSNSAGMIIQHYDFCVRRAGRVVYEGDTYFGFFSKGALANQVGIREAKPYQPAAAEIARARPLALPDAAPLPDVRLRMIDGIDLWVPDGGSRGLGFVRGTKKVDPGEWFFKAHFYQDPVCPGSLGLESFLQLLRAVARDRWGDVPTHTVAIGKPHTWVYRGQVIPTDALVTVQAEITAVDDDARLLTADGFLSVDGRVIYQMTDFTLQAGPKMSPSVFSLTHPEPRP